MTRRPTKKRTRTAVLIGTLLATLAGPVFAGDAVLFIGQNDFQDTSDARTTFGLELHSDPLWQIGAADISIGGTIVGHENGDHFIGAGVSAILPLGQKWFAEGSFMPGLYNPVDSTTDLGNSLEFRTMIGVGRWLNGRNAISLGLTHKSNGGLSDQNPGVNALSLRYRFGF